MTESHSNTQHTHTVRTLNICSDAMHYNAMCSSSMAPFQYPHEGLNTWRKERGYKVYSGHAFHLKTRGVDVTGCVAEHHGRLMVGPEEMGSS